ncbi:MAG: hypothetical protein HRU20_22030 [Pseudomonadales bacterium]|nr:hypothetical protein [Pseudomonadales bacterium]
MIEELLRNREYEKIESLFLKDPSVIMKRVEPTDSKNKKPGKYLPVLVVEQIKVDYAGKGLKERVVENNNKLIELYLSIAKLAPDINHEFLLIGSLFQIAQKCKSAYLLKELVNLGANADVKDSKLGHSFHSLTNTPEMVRVFLNAGIDPNLRNEKGRTLLHLNLDSIEVSRVLLEFHADVNSMDSMGNTPLMIQAKQSSLGSQSTIVKRSRVIDFLIENGGLLNFNNSQEEGIFELLSENTDSDDFLPIFHKHIDYSTIGQIKAFELAKAYVSLELYKELSVFISDLRITGEKYLEELVESICERVPREWLESEKLILITKIITKSSQNKELIQFSYDAIKNSNNDNLLRYTNKSLVFKSVNSVTEADSSDFSDALEIIRDVVGRKKNKPLAACTLSDLLDTYTEMCGVKHVDVESIEGAGSYTALLGEVVKLATDWCDIDIFEEEVNGQVHLKVRHENWCKDISLKIENDYVDGEFFGFLCDISKDFLEYRFCLLPAIDQVVRIVYMPDRLLDIFERNGLI